MYEKIFRVNNGSGITVGWVGLGLSRSNPIFLPHQTSQGLQYFCSTIDFSAT